jgi:hypothetical protein
MIRKAGDCIYLQSAGDSVFSQNKIDPGKVPTAECIETINCSLADIRR